MLRPRKKYTVFDLRQLKGKRCLTHIHVKSPQEAAAAEQAGVDLMSCSFDNPEAQARLPHLVAAAPQSFLSAATPHGLASPEEAIRVAFRALEIGASSVYCSASPFIIEAMARERIPVVGHLGMVPRHVTWTGYRAIGRTVEEATQLYHRMKELENAGAYAERPPRHAKAYRNFAAEHRRLQQERLAAFREYIADVSEGRFPERSHLVEMEELFLEKVTRSIAGETADNND